MAARILAESARSCVYFSVVYMCSCDCSSTALMLFCASLSDANTSSSLTLVIVVLLFVGVQFAAGGIMSSYFNFTISSASSALDTNDYNACTVRANLVRSRSHWSLCLQARNYLVWNAYPPLIGPSKKVYSSAAALYKSGKVTNNSHKSRNSYRTRIPWRWRISRYTRTWSWSSSSCTLSLSFRFITLLMTVSL